MSLTDPGSGAPWLQPSAAPSASSEHLHSTSPSPASATWTTHLITTQNSLPKSLTILTGHQVELAMKHRYSFLQQNARIVQRKPRRDHFLTLEISVCESHSDKPKHSMRTGAGRAQRTEQRIRRGHPGPSPTSPAYVGRRVGWGGGPGYVT